MRPSPHKIQTVTSIGAGPIGGGWAAFFLSRGYQVRAYLHSMDEEPIFRAIIDTAWTSLQQIGLAVGASRYNLIITDDLEQAGHDAHGRQPVDLHEERVLRDAQPDALRRVLREVAHLPTDSVHH